METESRFCVNCGSAGLTNGFKVLENKQILNCIRKWTAPLSVQSHNLVCKTCWDAAQEVIEKKSVSRIGRNCALCKKSLALRTRQHQVIAFRTDTQHHVTIKNIVEERLLPLEVRASHYICHACWQKADRAAIAKLRSASSSKTAVASYELKCANCAINLSRMKRHILNDDAVLVQIQQKMSPKEVTASDYICDGCHRVYVNSDPVKQEPQEEGSPVIGHRRVCLRCGFSSARARKYTLGDESNKHILDVVRNWIQPRQVEATDIVCYRCFRKADTEVKANISVSIPDSRDVSPVPQRTETITLPNYARASDTRSRCIFLQCNSTLNSVVSLDLRVKIFKEHNYYIPANCLICEKHLTTQPWNELLDAENLNRRFTASHIEDIFELLKQS